MFRSLPLLAGALLLTACVRPEPALVPPAAPLVVRLALKTDAPVDAATQQAWAEAFRDRLAGQAQILPGDGPVEGAGLLEITVEPLARGQAVGRATADASGRAFGVGWDAIKAESQDLRDQLAAGAAGLVSGTVCALVTAPVSAGAAQTRALFHQARLGYKPRHVVLTCRYQAGPGAKAEEILTTRAMDVVKRMRPMSTAQAHQPGRLAAEEGRAAAQLLSERLAQRGWRPIRRSASPE